LHKSHFHTIIRTFIFVADGRTDSMTKNPKRTYNITALQRGLKLLNLFAKAESGLTATQVAKLSALPTSTVHRFLVNLESGGFLNSTSHGTFHLGMACFALGQAGSGIWIFGA